MDRTDKSMLKQMGKKAFIKTEKKDIAQAKKAKGVKNGKKKGA